MAEARNPLVALGALNAALAVVAGAFGAHALRSRLEPRMLEVFETGARYHLIHAVAMVVMGLLASRAAATSGWIFQAGIVLFSGSLYALALTGTKALGAITPLGGLCFIVGWLYLAYASLRA